MKQQRTPHAELIRLRQYKRLQAAAMNVRGNGMARKVRGYMQEFLAQQGWTLAELALANEQANTPYRLPAQEIVLRPFL